MKKAEERRDIALFRYGIISSLVNKVLASGELTAKLKEISNQEYQHPFSGKFISYSIRTLFLWLKIFREKGIDGLFRKERKDKGTGRKLKKEVLEKARELRRDREGRTDLNLIKILSQMGIKGIKRSTLNRQLLLSGYSRRDLRVLDNKIYGRFESEHVNHLWIGDYHDKRGLLAGTDRQIHLCLFMDCHSRYTIHGEYYLSEDLFTLEDSFRKGVIKHGVSTLIYVDNAKIYHSRRFEYCCLKIGTHCVYSKPYESEGRGKIEKLNRYIKENFEAEAIHRGGFSDLAELNEHFWAWLEIEYQQKYHSEIKCTPEERFKAYQNFKYPDLRILKELFLTVDNRIVDKKTAVVNVLGKRFVTDSFLKGHKVEVHYDLHDLSYVLIYYRGIFVMKAKEQELNVKTAGQDKKDRNEGEARLKYDFLSALKGEYDKLLRENAALMKIHSGKEKQNDFYYVQDLEKQLNFYLKRKLKAEEQELVIQFYDQYRIERKETVAGALSYATQHNGLHHHISFYLDYIKVFLFSERRKNYELP